jgi:hypothetical protein
MVGAIDEDFAPVALLALLKHPLCTLGGDRAAVLDARAPPRPQMPARAEAHARAWRQSAPGSTRAASAT